MKRQFTDTHIQIESGNDVFDGTPHQVVRREFSEGVVWFKKPIVMGENLERLDENVAQELENLYAGDVSFVGGGRDIITS